MAERRERGELARAWCSLKAPGHAASRPVTGSRAFYNGGCSRDSDRASAVFAIGSLHCADVGTEISLCSHEQWPESDLRCRTRRYL